VGTNITLVVEVKTKVLPFNAKDPDGAKNYWDFKLEKIGKHTSSFSFCSILSKE
jgi:hypothetical protein